ncbi:MAG: hypothetical protein JKY45_00595 [Emcibacter sp.]|nr:hypothetical protein [Emcibacter sp.]
MPNTTEALKENEYIPKSPLLDTEAIVNTMAQQITKKGLELPATFHFIWHDIKFSGELLQAKEDNLFTLILVAKLGHIPFSAEDKNRRRNLLETLSPLFIAKDYNLSINSQVEKTLHTDFSGPISAKRLMEVIAYVLLDQQDDLKSVQTSIIG